MVIQRLRRAGGAVAVSNAIWSYMLQAANLVSSVAVIPLLSRALGAEGFGAYAGAFNLLTYLSVVTGYGFQLWGSREIARAEGTAARGRIFYTVLWTKLVLLLMVTPAWLACVFVLSDGQGAEAIAILFVALIGLTLNSSWLFLGLQQLRAPAIAAAMTKVAVVAYALIAIREPGDLSKYCLAYGLGCLVEAVLQFVQARPFVDLHPVWDGISSVLLVLQNSFALFVTTALGTFLAGASIFVLGIVSTKAEVGGFAGVLKIVQFLVTMFVPLSNALYPDSCRVEDSGLRGWTARPLGLIARVIPVFVILCAAIYLGRTTLVARFLGPGFEQYASLIGPLVLWVLFAVLANLVGVHGLVARDRQRAYLVSMAIATVLTYVLAFAWGATSGATGTSWAMLVGEVAGVGAMVGFLLVFGARTKSGT